MTACAAPVMTAVFMTRTSDTLLCRMSPAASAAAASVTTPASSNGGERDSTGTSLEARAGTMAQSAANWFPVWVLVGWVACSTVRCAWPCSPRRI